MRSILSLAIGLLLVAVLWRVERSSMPGDSAGVGNAREGLYLIAAAQGHLLPRATLGGGPEHLGSVLLVGALNLRRESADPGLRVAIIAGDGELVEHRNYDVAHSASDALDFIELPALQPVGTLVMIASTDRIQPEEPSPKLQRAVETLGARSEPFERTPLSWALITLRRPDGWVMLAEGLGHESGVVLAFTLGADHTIYDFARTGFRGDYLIQRGEEEIAVRLFDEVLSSAERSGRVKAQPGVGEPLNNPSQLEMLLRAGPSNSEGRVCLIAWEGLWLGSQPHFHCRLGLRAAPKATSVGAIFSLLIDGEVLGEREISGEPASIAPWTEWDVDLAEHAGSVVRIELRATPTASLIPALALWSRPTVSYAPDLIGN